MKLREHYQVNEIFDSIQGEGVLVGTPATFIRLQGCTVGCHWCDSGPLADLPTEQDMMVRYTAAEGNVIARGAIKNELDAFRTRQTNGLTRNTWTKGGERMTVDEIVEQVRRHHVIVTGGEPTMYNLDGLLVPLQENGHYVQLETSGQNDIKGNVNPDWVTWSPKENLDFQGAFSIKEQAKEVKWVLDGNLSLDEHVWPLFEWYVHRRTVTEGEVPYFVLMPEGCPPKEEFVQEAVEWLKGLPRWAVPFWRFGDRLQYRIGAR